MHAESLYEHESVRKSKRIPKRRVIDMGFDGDDDDADEEIRYLGRISASKVSSDGIQMEDKMYFDMKDYYLSNSNKDGIAKLRSEKLYEDRDYMEDEKPMSDDEPGYKSKTLGFVEGRNKKGPNLIEFPNGLTPAPPKSKCSSLFFG